MALESVDVGDEEVELLGARVGHSSAGVDLGGQATSETDHRERLLLA
jgi:hypothetical protein